MRVVVCPDSFSETLTAPEVAAAIVDGWAQVSADTLLSLPLSDGGPGFVDVMRRLPGAVVVEVATTDPLGRPVQADIVCLGDRAYIESAQACGLHVLSGRERQPLTTTTFGLGALITAAAARGVREIVVGLGGSGTNDAGSGMLRSLGAVPVDVAGVPLPPGGGALGDCLAIAGTPEWGSAVLVAATDVDNPLTGMHGASHVFGPQKGASPPEVALLETAITHFAEIMERDLGACPAGLSAIAGGGAAGGLGAALLALGGRRESGFALVRDAIGLEQVMANVDLVITGEGSFDFQSLRGKVVSGVAEVALEHGVPCVVVAGRSTVGRREAAAVGVSEVHTLAEHFGDMRRAMTEAKAGLLAIGAQLARQWGRMSQ